jgi:hypothetical protein
VVFSPSVAWWGAPLDIFKSYAKAHHIKAPVFIMHGTADVGKRDSAVLLWW